MLIKDCPEKQWKYNTVSEKYLNLFVQVADEMQISNRGFAMHVDNCPIRKREWRGKPYANFINDCLYCKYCIAHKNNVLCSGSQRIASIKDFSISEKEQKKASDKERSEEQTVSFTKGKCPNCGCNLVERNSKYGIFGGCSSFPHCRYTASIDDQTGEIIMKA